MKLNVNLDDRGYPVYIENGLLKNLKNLLPPNRYAIVTDTGVPEQWVELVHKQLPDSFVIEIEQGEPSKCMACYEQVLQAMAKKQMTRSNAVIALGGGVVGDLAGFAAATYMRGIDFYNIPTTVLSQVDSSVGGKTAIDLGSLKNIVGAFWQPKAVFIDPQVLSTLPLRHVANGLAEAIKMGLILDPALFEAFEQENLDLEWIIARSIDLKRQVVEEDEKESGLRKILNFGHTIGHAIEGSCGFETYLHGECVAMGILFFLEDPALKQRVENVLDRLGLPSIPSLEVKAVMNRLRHDKKGTAQGADVILVPALGQHEIRPMTWEQIQTRLEAGLKTDKKAENEQAEPFEETEEFEEKQRAAGQADEVETI